MTRKAYMLRFLLKHKWWSSRSSRSSVISGTSRVSGEIFVQFSNIDIIPIDTVDITTLCTLHTRPTYIVIASWLFRSRRDIPVLAWVVISVRHAQLCYSLPLYESIYQILMFGWRMQSVVKRMESKSTSLMSLQPYWRQQGMNIDRAIEGSWAESTAHSDEGSRDIAVAAFPVSGRARCPTQVKYFWDDGMRRTWQEVEFSKTHETICVGVVGASQGLCL